MNVVDSSGWLEYFDGAANAEHFDSPIRDAARLVVPTVVLVEVRRRLLVRDEEEEKIEAALALLAQGRSVPLTEEIAASAASLGVQHKLPLADSIIYATARSTHAEVWTQDADFEGLPGVRYFPKDG